MGYTQLALESQEKASAVQEYACARAARLQAQVQALARSQYATKRRELDERQRSADEETPEGSPERDDPDLAPRKKPRRGLPLSDWGRLQRRLDPETTVPKTDTDVAESLLNLSSPSNSTLNLSRAVSLLDDAELGDLASAEAQFMKDLQERSAKKGLLGAACRVRVEV